VIPLISPTDREELWHFWPDISYPVIAVSYLSLKKRTRLYKAARDHGIKDAIGFDGTVISVLVGENWLLDHTPVQRYHHDVSQMGFDAATTHDDYTYRTNSSHYRYHRLHRLLDRARELAECNPQYDLIGIVKGSSPAEIQFCVDSLRDIGIAKTALPCSELVFEKRHEDIHQYLRYCRDLGLWTWLIGLGSPHLMRRFGADCYSSSKWCYSSTLGYRYSRDSVKQTPVPPNCYHELCRTLVEKRRPMDVILARHNVSTLIEIGRDLREVGSNGQR